MELRPADDPAPSPLRCTVRRRATGADPAGSAGCYDAFVVVESPLPWERDATGCWPFVDLGWSGAATAGPDGRSWRAVVVVPTGASPPGRVAVTAWERPAGTVAPFTGRRFDVPAAEVPGLIDGLVGGGTGPGADAGWAAPPAVLVCTHGRRDVCCGSLGTQLAAGMVAGPGGPEVHRCSHTGGHRFAPTALTFPDGLAWAHLDPPRADELLRRSTLPSPELVAACRGAAQLPPGPAQVADREGLAALGWAWADSERTVEVLGAAPARPGDPPVEVRLGGPVGSGTVVVEVDEVLPAPPCGAPEDGGPDVGTETTWRVVEARIRPA